jgi:hypothetical protein
LHGDTLGEYAAWIQALQAFPTTTKQDAVLLAEMAGGHDLRSECLKLTIRYRMLHKRAIAQGYKLASSCLDKLLVLPIC